MKTFKTLLDYFKPNDSGNVVIILGGDHYDIHECICYSIERWESPIPIFEGEHDSARLLCYRHYVDTPLSNLICHYSLMFGEIITDNATHGNTHFIIEYDKLSELIDCVFAIEQRNNELSEIIDV